MILIICIFNPKYYSVIYTNVKRLLKITNGLKLKLGLIVCFVINLINLWCIGILDYTWMTDGCDFSDIPDSYQYDKTVTVLATSGAGHCRVEIVTNPSNVQHYQITTSFYNNGSTDILLENYGNIGFLFNQINSAAYDFVYLR